MSSHAVVIDFEFAWYAFWAAIILVNSSAIRDVRRLERSWIAPLVLELSHPNAVACAHPGVLSVPPQDPVRVDTCRHASCVAGVPASSPPRIATICTSLERFFRIVSR